MMKGEIKSPALVLVLSLITCGIYGVYWIYKTSDEVQKFLGLYDSLTPAVETILCIFTCGIYAIYWSYKYGKLISDCQRKVDLPVEENAVLYLVLAIFGLSLVNYIIMQNSLNKVWERA